MLRDALTRLPGFATWPCDELPYVWRHGNRGRTTDEFSRADATPRVVRSVRRRFARLAGGTGATYLVEKTCANTLRVGFVDRILPEARFVVITRDGRDVTASAARRWTAPLDLAYAARKARYTPLTDAPFHAVEVLRNRRRRRGSQGGRIEPWGPRFAGMTELLVGGDPLEASAAQWRRCVERSERELTGIDPDRVHHLRYEDFVADPAGHLRGLTGFLGATMEQHDVLGACAGVSDRHVGAWRLELSPDALRRLEPTLREPLERLGYRW
ncbi:MAG: sulfotransferase [Actinobacteria bacterium]|nr:sulfotransferase [Actinomycetota bacterium]